VNELGIEKVLICKICFTQLKYKGAVFTVSFFDFSVLYYIVMVRVRNKGRSLFHFQERELILRERFPFLFTPKPPKGGF